MSKVDPIQIARERLQALAEEWQRLQQFIQTYELLAGQQEPAPPPSRQVDCEAVNLPYNVTMVLPPRKRRPSTRMERITKATREILRANGKPMHLNQIHAELTARGIEIGGKRPRNGLGAILSASEEFWTKRGEGWWFRNEELPTAQTMGSSQINGAAGHHPATAPVVGGVTAGLASAPSATRSH